MFLRLDLNALSHEDTIILSNLVESAGVVETFDSSMQDKIQKIMDLISIAHAFHEMKVCSAVCCLPSYMYFKDVSQTSRACVLQGKDGGLKALLQGQSPIPSGGKFVEDPTGPRRCHGRTQSGARCKLTEESIHRLHGRCAEAAKPLAKGAKYCSFHKDQKFM